MAAEQTSSLNSDSDVALSADDVVFKWSKQPSSRSRGQAESTLPVPLYSFSVSSSSSCHDLIHGKSLLVLREGESSSGVLRVFVFGYL